MKLATATYSGVVYRAHHPKWAHAPLSGEGAKQHGGRFNRPGKPALYTSLDLTTAWLEAQQAFPFKVQPMTIVAYRVECDSLADLTLPVTLKHLGIKPADLACAWEYLAIQNLDPPTWTLADRLHNQGISGALVPSFAPGCTIANKNLVLWTWQEKQSPCIEVIDDFGRLPNEPSAGQKR